MVAFMDTTATIPTGAMAERWKWKAFVGWGLFCGAIYYPLFGAWTWGGGWLAKLGNTARARLRLRRLRRLRRRARGRWCRRARRCDRPRCLASASTARTASRARCPAHNIPMAHARHVHPAVRLVRLQRRVDVRGDRRALRRRRRRTPRSRPRSVRPSRCSTSMRRIGQARPGHDGNGMLAGLVAITAPCAFVQPGPRR